MTNAIIKAAAIFFLMITNAHASNVGDHMKSGKLSVEHLGLKIAHKALSNTRPAIRMLNVAIPVDMSGFKNVATKWSVKMDAKVLKKDTEVLNAKKALNAKITAKTSNTQNNDVMPKSLAGKASMNNPFDTEFSL